MFKLPFTFILSASALSAVYAQDILGLSWNSTSPFGKSTGVFTLQPSTFGYSMVFADGTSTLSATYDATSGVVTQVCPFPGLVAAMIPLEGSTGPETFLIEWVEAGDVGTLPGGSSITSLVPGDGAFVTTMGSPNGAFPQNGVFKEVTVDNVLTYAWTDETFEENEDVTSWIDIFDGSSISC
ncbi:hypothetical protein BDP27DRAFT_1336298 [Rhodocollybia butyracea]|uniref:Uncharacterized protein n=1 Tax=Rhodocollybia butyracea TaxID=206335 RepID=A0A9P5U183_9AGAR|nr:hypothetical protein BDP27DRAFT_1336298 [Rhodocollybia butyracea]